MSALADAPFTLLLRNCRVATMAANTSAPYGAVLDASIGVAGERIAFVGPASAVPQGRVAAGTEIVDLGGRWVTPGLVDCHTHVAYGARAEWS
ncbi:imidazolonepropionase [Aureococcus anophagefferens]|nr:imidazolonepropionase [Aureococcus anophagefferens]